MTRLQLLLVGGESVAVQYLQRLRARDDVTVVAVVAAQAAANPLPRAAAAAGVPEWPLAMVSTEASTDAIGSGIDLLLNVHSLHLLPHQVVEAPRIGSYNLHPGPLPEYAGLNPTSWAIYHGEPTHGVTVHAMTARTDAGPIAFERRFPLAPEDTALTVSARCVNEGLDLLDELVTTVAAGRPVPAHPQDMNQRRYFPAGPPGGGRIDWRWNSRRVHGLVRACDYAPFRSPWGQAWTTTDTHTVEVLSVDEVREPTSGVPGTVTAHDEDRAVVATGDGAVAITRLRIDGARPAPGEALPIGTAFHPPD